MKTELNFLSKIVGSFQVSEADRRLFYKSGTKSVVGWPIREGKFSKIIGVCIAKNKKQKIVGVGLGKTGTTSLAHCLTYLGYQHQWYDPKLFLDFYTNREKVLEVLRMKDSFEDFPWPFLYKEIDLLYPDSKFILTLRKDPQTWYKSLCKHFDRGSSNLQKQLAYGFDTPHDHEQEHIELYCRHSLEVKEHFTGRNSKLLTVCWETGDGWREVCNFLGHTVPSIPFPHANKAPDWQ